MSFQQKLIRLEKDIKALRGSKARLNLKQDKSFSGALAGTVWNLDLFPVREITLVANTSLTTVGTAGLSRGILHVKNTGSFTLTIDGVSQTIVNNGECMIAAFYKMSGVYYSSDSGGSGSSAVLLAEDTFDSANITNISGRTTTSGSKTWVAVVANTGTLGISSNAAKLTSAGGTIAKATLDVDVRNVDVRAVVGTGTGNNAYLLLGYTDENSYIQVHLEDGSTNQFVAGVPTLIIPSVGTASASGNEIKAVLSGTTLTIYRNGTQIGTTNSVHSSIVGDKHGIYFYQNTTSSIDKVSIYNV